MNILHVVRSSITVTSFLLPFMEAQRLQGNDVAVAFDANEDAEGIESRNIRVHKYNLARSLSLANLYKALRSLKLIIDHGKYDLIIAHMPMAGAITRLAVKFSSCNAKVVYVSHGLPCAPKQAKLRWLFWFTVEWVLGRITDALFVMNQYDYALARRTKMLPNPNLVRKIPGMGVDIEEFSTDIDASYKFFSNYFNVPKHRKVVLFVGRIIKEKGVFDFLKAAESLSDEDYSFFLVGDGPLNSAISNFIERRGLTDKVFFLGLRNDVPTFMKRCDVLVLPTYYFEGLPVVILEAMACGKPVIATRHRGCEDEVVDGETGYLIDAKNPRQLAGTIEKLLGNPSLCKRMGMAGRKRVVEHFALSIAVESFLKELADL